MFTNIKLRSWTLEQLEDLAIGYHYNVPHRVLASLFKRSENAVSKATNRCGLRGQKGAPRGAKPRKMRSYYDTPTLAGQLIKDIRQRYQTSEALYQHLKLKGDTSQTSIKTLQSRFSTHTPIHKKKTISRFKDYGVWTSLYHIIAEARKSGLKVQEIQPLHSVRFNQAAFICDGLPANLHQLLLAVNRARKRKNLPLLFLAGTTDQ